MSTRVILLAIIPFIIINNLKIFMMIAKKSFSDKKHR